MTRADLVARAAELRAERTPFVLATVVRALRPTSAKPGDQAIVLSDGAVEGFVGGACSRTTVRLHALRLLAAGRATLLRVTPTDPSAVSAASAGTKDASDTEGLSGDAAGPRPDQPLGDSHSVAEGAEEGMVTVANPCLSGGTLDIFLEAVRPPVLVHVVGDTPLAHALTMLGQAVGWDVHRDDTGVDAAADADAVVVASQGGDERRVLTAALRTGVPYVGLVASRRRGAAVIDGLALGAGELRRLHTPAGYDIGAHTPGEVAVAILAEIIACRAAAHAADGGAAEAVDPVCGMAVPAAADRPGLQYAGRDYYFCAPGCRDRFAAEPGRYTEHI